MLGDVLQGNRTTPIIAEHDCDLPLQSHFLRGLAHVLQVGFAAFLKQAAHVVMEILHAYLCIYSLSRSTIASVTGKRDSSVEWLNSIWAIMHIDCVMLGTVRRYACGIAIDI